MPPKFTVKVTAHSVTASEFTDFYVDNGMLFCKFRVISVSLKKSTIADHLHSKSRKKRQRKIKPQPGDLHFSLLSRLTRIEEAENGIDFFGRKFGRNGFADRFCTCKNKPTAHVEYDLLYSFGAELENGCSKITFGSKTEIVPGSRIGRSPGIVPFWLSKGITKISTFLQARKISGVLQSGAYF